VRQTFAAALAVALMLAVFTGGPSPRPTVSHRPSNANRASPAALRLTRASFELDGALQREVAESAGHLIYLAGGLGASGTSTSDVSTLDPATRRTTPRCSRRPAVHDAAGAFIGGKLFVFGGGPEVGTDVVQTFDPATGTSRIAGHLPRALSDLGAATVGGTVYLVGGFDGRTPQAAILATSTGTRFQRVATLPQGLRYPAVTAIGPGVLIAGGVTSNGPTRDVLLFDPSNGRVHVIGRLPVAVGHAMAFVLGDVAYVVGGEDADGRRVRIVCEVDPSAGAPIRRLSRKLPRAMSDAAVAAIGGAEYILGGSNGSSLRQVLRASVRSSG